MAISVIGGKIMKKISVSKEYEIKYITDIVVAGGGPSGVAATTTAARLGKNVIIIEQSGTFGGASMLSGVPELVNFDDGIEVISKGFGEEIFNSLEFDIKDSKYGHYYRPEVLKRLYDKLICESGAKVLFYTRIVDAVCLDGCINQIIVSGNEGLYAIDAKCFIDCTGNGSLCALAGASYEYGDENEKTMSATLCSLWAGVDFERKKMGSDGDNVENAYDDGVFSQYDTILPGIKPNMPDVGVGGGNVGHCFGVDDRSTESLTEATFLGRKILEEYETYYTKYVPGCENAQLIRSADYIGIRESKRIKCEYTLNKDDFFKPEPFYDEIGRYSYPIDIHPLTSDKNGMDGFLNSISMRHEKGGSYSIPYRSLVPVDLKNVLVAGKTIGTDHYMQASVRVIPGCYITGQGAGVAAAVCVSDNTSCKDADINKIKEILKEITKK